LHPVQIHRRKSPQKRVLQERQTIRNGLAFVVSGMHGGGVIAARIANVVAKRGGVAGAALLALL